MTDRVEQVRFDARTAQRITEAASTHAGLALLLLYGSRARNEVTPYSDWDLGYLADERFDVDSLRVDLVRILETEDVDLVDLSRASAQLRFRAAQDGEVVFASHDDAFPRFWHEAVRFWCEAAHVLQRGYADLLNGLPRS